MSYIRYYAMRHIGKITKLNGSAHELKWAKKFYFFVRKKVQSKIGGFHILLPMDLTIRHLLQVVKND